MRPRNICTDRVGRLLWHLAAVALALWPRSAVAQKVDLRVDRLSIDKGLAHPGVRSIAQDHLGFLWIGTQAGLDRFDGYRFEMFKHDPADPDSLADSEVMAMAVDHAGTLWLGTRGGGLDRFRQADEGFDHFRHAADDPASLSHDDVRSLLVDSAGNLWAGTLDGLNRRDRRTGNFTRYLHSSGPQWGSRSWAVLTLFEDRRGDLWIGTDHGLSLWQPQSESFIHYRHDPADPASLSHDTVNAIAEDTEGDLWIATEWGLNRFDRGTGRFERHLHAAADETTLPANKLFALHVDRTGELWIGTDNGGLARFDRSTGSFATHRHDPADVESLSSNTILGIFEDRAGLLWFTTYLGLNRYDRTREQFVTYRRRSQRRDSLSSDVVRGLLEDADGNLWIGTLGAGLNVLDRRNDSVRVYRPAATAVGSLPHGNVDVLYRDRAGVLWIGTRAGLARYDPEADRFVHYRQDPEGLESLDFEYVSSLLEDRSGRLWVGTFRGLSSFDRQRQAFQRYPARPGDPQVLARTPVLTMLEDHCGMVWIGTIGAGLFRFEPEGERFDHYPSAPADPEGLASDKVSYLHEDRAGRLWVGTFNGGLNRIDVDRQRFKRYSERDGLPSDSILAILEDEDGMLWLSTYRGLSQFDPAAETFRNFDVDDGLQGEMFSIGSAYRSPSGEMFFGGVHGLNAFFPDAVTGDSQAPAVVINDFRLFNEPVGPRRRDPSSPLEQAILATDEIVLSHRDYVISFGFAALHFAHPHKYRYAYRLEGFDRDWQLTDASRRYAQYSNLAPGEYVFRVKAANAAGVWNEDGASLPLRVLPAPWRTWWAYLLYLMAISAVAWGYVRSHQRQLASERALSTRLREQSLELEHKNAELERFTYTVSHDLKSPLVTINGFLAMMERSARAGRLDDMVRDRQRIHQAVAILNERLDQLLELSRIGRRAHLPRSIALQEVIDKAIELLHGAIDAVGLDIAVSADLPSVEADPQRLLEVLQNLLSNAAKFTGDQPHPRVVISAHEVDGWVEIALCDNGVGIDPRYLDKVFGLFEQLDQQMPGSGIGLAIVKRIVEVHGGHIRVQSDGLGTGCCFYFTLPAALKGH